MRTFVNGVERGGEPSSRKRKTIHIQWGKRREGTVINTDKGIMLKTDRTAISLLKEACENFRWGENQKKEESRA